MAEAGWRVRGGRVEGERQLGGKEIIWRVKGGLEGEGWIGG